MIRKGISCDLNIISYLFHEWILFIINTFKKILIQSWSESQDLSSSAPKHALLIRFKNLLFSLISNFSINPLPMLMRLQSPCLWNAQWQAKKNKTKMKKRKKKKKKSNNKSEEMSLKSISINTNNHIKESLTTLNSC